MRLYTAVLHLHRSPLSVSLGPLYDCPGSKAGTKNAAYGDKIVCNAPKVHLLTAIVARRRQVRCDPAGILLERLYIQTPVRCEKRIVIDTKRASEQREPTQEKVESMQLGALT